MIDMAQASVERGEKNGVSARRASGTSWPVTSVVVIGMCSLGIHADAVPPDFTRTADSRRQSPLTDADGQPTSTPQGIRNINLDSSASLAATGADDCNDAPVAAVTVGTPGSPNTVSITGDTTPATGPECDPGLRTSWWEAFELDRCANVIVDFCGTSPTLRPNYVVVGTSCAADGSSCGGYIGWDPGTGGRALCPNPETDDNITMFFTGLPAGTYYYPIIADGQSGNVPGPYVMHVTAEECVGDCSGCLGACCDTDTESCTEDIAQVSCSGDQQLWLARASCCEVECRDPAGPEFNALNVNLLSRVTIADFAAFNESAGNPHTGNEMWGYTSPPGRKFAIIGFTTGTGIVDITNPRASVIVAFIDGGVDTTWRDMATHKQYLYIVTDGDGIGIQIVDLSDIDSGNVTLVATSDLGMGFVDAHNVYINPDSGFLYLAIPNLNGGNGLTAVSLSDPVNPQFAGFWTDTVANVRCHDVQVVSYSDGPNAGREIAFCFAEDDGLKIADVTIKNAMFTISTLTYPTLSYCHQGWSSEDRQYVFFDDELDELFGAVAQTTTYVADVQDLANPTLAATFTHAGCWIDHNLHVRGDRVYQAHYSAGLRVLDASNPLALAEVAHFDTRPADNVQGFPGAWGVFADFPTRIVVLSDRQRGLFVLCDEPEKPLPGFVVDQNPATRAKAINFDARSSTTCDPSRLLVNYEWDFAYDGVNFDVDATGPTVTHTYAAVGVYSVALRVTDDLSNHAISAFEIRVSWARVLVPKNAECRPVSRGSSAGKRSCEPINRPE